MGMTQEDRIPAKGKLRTAARAAARHLPAGLPPVLYLTDPARTPDPVATAQALPAGWGVIYRHFGQPGHAELARKLAQVCRKRHLRLLIAADPVTAGRVGADGVHWPFSMKAEARRWHGRFAMMTVSAHSPHQLRSLQDTDVSGVLFSTAFPSTSPSARAPLGATRFRALARRSSLPVYALGGMNAQTARSVASVAGVAAIEGIEAVFGPRI